MTGDARLRLYQAKVHECSILDPDVLTMGFARRVPSGSRQRVLVEVNCGGEAQKAGAEPGMLPGLLDAD